MKQHKTEKQKDIETVLKADAWARKTAEEI
jgi:hypothetical protein